MYSGLSIAPILLSFTLRWKVQDKKGNNKREGEKRLKDADMVSSILSGKMRKIWVSERRMCDRVVESVYMCERVTVSALYVLYKNVVVVVVSCVCVYGKRWSGGEKELYI